MVRLPIDDLLPELVETLKQHSNVVLEAPPGAGKTTRVPPALLPITQGEVWVLEPRRLAARLAARRVAEELGEPLGDTVGYQVRFEQAGGRNTRLRFFTEGVLTRRLLSDPRLDAASLVILDEFHERHLDTDLALALLRHLQRTTRPDLKLVVMSATLDAAPIAAYLNGCPILRTEGRLFPMDVRYRPHSTDPLEDQVRQSVEAILAEPTPGDLLVFLPGANEIRRAATALARLAERHNLLLTPLHGDLTPEEQDRAVTPNKQRKVILSTNVAESSVTIDGVTVVIDSGLARVASHSPWSGLPTLQIKRISQASATQRAGRSARTAPGRVIRLYPQDDLIRRAARDLPEIQRDDLSSLTLTLKAMGIRHFDELPWLDAPPDAAIQAAETLLDRLIATNPDGSLSPLGKRMAQCPLEPRLARIVIEGEKRGVPDAATLAACLLSLGARLPDDTHRRLDSDIFALLEGTHPGNTRRLANAVTSAMRLPQQKKQDDAALRQAILAGFPDRVAKRRQGDELLLAGGGSAVLAKTSTVRNPQWMVAIDIEERKERGLPLVRLASGIEPDWLIDLYTDHITEKSAVEWNRQGERVESVSAMLYDGLTVEESRGGKVDPELAATLLAQKAREAGVVRFTDVEEVNAFLARLRFAAKHTDRLPAWTEDDALDALAELAQGKRSFHELEQEAKDGGLVRHLESRLAGDRRLLDELAPQRWKLPNGRGAKLEYIDDQAPRLSSRLQDFFGMKDTPKVANGKVPVVVLLLAPNQRPVQTTTDLAGFWERWYPQVRKELMRRYPKHQWPENP